MLHEHAIGEFEEIIDIDDERIMVVTRGNHDSRSATPSWACQKGMIRSPA
jgi:metallophosphoesterase superfamily enzyme